jgi:hypothetical protein
MRKRKPKYASKEEADEAVKKSKRNYYQNRLYLGTASEDFAAHFSRFNGRDKVDFIRHLLQTHEIHCSSCGR